MPSTTIIRPYEAVYILDPDSGEEQIAAVTDRYKGLIEAQGGQVQKIDIWERRKLAYAVKGRNEGIYVIMQFTGHATVEAELRRVFQISEDQLRSLIVRLDEDDAPAAQTIPAAAPAAQAAPAPIAEPAPAPVPMPETAPALETAGSQLDAAETAAPEAAATAA